MKIYNAKEWVEWIFYNNILYSRYLKRTNIQKMTSEQAKTYCQDYINAMVKKDGKRGILHQEKQMIKELGLNV